MFVSAIIAAGGRGLRFGGSSPKQLLTLGGRPILARSVDAFVACDVISEIVVALPADLAAAPPSYLEQRGKPVTVVSGGDERRTSVANAFARLDRAMLRDRHLPAARARARWPSRGRSSVTPHSHNPTPVAVGKTRLCA